MIVLKRIVQAHEMIGYGNHPDGSLVKAGALQLHFRPSLDTKNNRTMGIPGYGRTMEIYNHALTGNADCEASSLAIHIRRAYNGTGS